MKLRRMVSYAKRDKRDIIPFLRYYNKNETERSARGPQYSQTRRVEGTFYLQFRANDFLHQPRRSTHHIDALSRCSKSGSFDTIKKQTYLCGVCV